VLDLTHPGNLAFGRTLAEVRPAMLTDATVCDAANYEGFEAALAPFHGETEENARCLHRPSPHRSRLECHTLLVQCEHMFGEQDQ